MWYDARVANMRAEDEYLDVLQNIEWAIIAESRHDESILDADARNAVDFLVRRYEAELESRGASNRPLTDRVRRIVDATGAMCEWRLGRGAAPGGLSGSVDPLNLEALVLCLKKIRKSIDFWNKEYGKRGYLDFVGQYVE